MLYQICKTDLEFRESYLKQDKMKKKIIFFSIMLIILISMANIEAVSKHSNLSLLFTPIETLGQIDLPEANITCSSTNTFYGKCKTLEPYFCLNGAMAARCGFTGDQSHYCSAILVIICTLFPMETHP